MAGTNPPAFAYAISTLFPPEVHQNKKPAGALRAGGPKSACFSYSLCTPQRAGLMAVMMAMRAAAKCAAHKEVTKVKRFGRCVNRISVSPGANAGLDWSFARKLLFLPDRGEHLMLNRWHRYGPLTIAPHDAVQLGGVGAIGVRKVQL